MVRQRSYIFSYFYNFKILEYISWQDIYNNFFETTQNFNKIFFCMTHLFVAGNKHGKGLEVEQLERKEGIHAPDACL